jgi:hypothetical protein
VSEGAEATAKAAECHSRDEAAITASAGPTTDHTEFQCVLLQVYIYHVCIYICIYVYTRIYVYILYIWYVSFYVLYVVSFLPLSSTT